MVSWLNDWKTGGTSNPHLSRTRAKRATETVAFQMKKEGGEPHLICLPSVEGPVSLCRVHEQGSLSSMCELTILGAK